MVKKNEMRNFTPEQELFYLDRTDRNIGWISMDEQKILRKTTVGIAGCGGMGGLLAETFHRLGIGEIKLADNEAFDATNINRQMGATKKTLGKNKALETAKILKRICDDAKIITYPKGITEETAEDFVEGCDIICDEIEFFVSTARLSLHHAAFKSNIPIFYGNTVGFSTHLFLFTKDSMNVEELIGYDYEAILETERKIKDNSISVAESTKLKDTLLRCYAPEIPKYSEESLGNCAKRFFENSKISVVPTNIPLAVGFLANHVLLYYLSSKGYKRDVTLCPPMPGYLNFDSAKMETKVQIGKWW